MRLIDADALINRVVFHTDWSTDEKEAFEDEVNAEPTVEPERKTGKWVYKTTDAYIQRTCSACGWSERMYYRNRNQDGSIRNYCPNCGSYNGGG